MFSFIDKIEKLGIKEFIHYKDNIFDIFKNKDDFIILFDFMLYFYYDILNIFVKRDVLYFKNYKDQIEKIYNNNDLNKIQKKLQLVEETKIKLESNMNLKLLMDEFIIKFSEV